MLDSHSSSSPKRVEVIALNSLTADEMTNLDAEARSLVERRRKVMGPAYRLSYSEPFRPVRAQGTTIVDAHGHEFLDAYNNVASVGHNHPRVVDAVARQLRTLNTNTRYLQKDIIEYAEDLVATHDDALENVMFTCTGSEANDLAMRIARQVTGGTGIIVTDYAYHGCTRDVASWSPSSGAGNILAPEVRLVPPPDFFRDSEDWGRWFAGNVQRQIDDLKQRGISLAALVLDTLFSSDGIYPDPGMLAPAIDAVHAAGGLFISDEVQPGFGRTGSRMWGYQRSGVTPDIITMGKPMGNGMPIAGLVAKKALLDEFGQKMAYFNTFSGENAPVAAAQAVLDVIRDEGLLANAELRGAQLRTGMSDILTTYDVPGDVRGAGMYLGVEFVEDLDSKFPDSATTLAVVNGLRQRRVLTSTAGTYGNVIKVRPPLIYTQSDVDRYLTEFDYVIRHLADTRLARHTPSTAPLSGSISGVGDIESLREDLRRIIVEELHSLIGHGNG